MLYVAGAIPLVYKEEVPPTGWRLSFAGKYSSSNKTLTRTKMTLC